MKATALMVLVVFAVVTWALPARGAIITSFFDAGLEGWTSNLPAALTWDGAGGNPGGYAQFIETTPEETVTLFAPTHILDALSSAFLGETIYWEQKIFDTGSNVEGFAPYYLSISTSGFLLDGVWIPTVGAAWAGPTPAGETGWVPLATTLDNGGGWILAGTDWPTLLDNVNFITIQFELVNNGAAGDREEHVGVDNFFITPEPASACLLALGAVALICRRKRA